MPLRSGLVAITGQNGSGKSTLLAAILIGLGALPPTNAKGSTLELEVLPSQECESTLHVRFTNGRYSVAHQSSGPFKPLSRRKLQSLLPKVVHVRQDEVSQLLQGASGALLPLVRCASAEGILAACTACTGRLSREEATLADASARVEHIRQCLDAAQAYCDSAPSVRSEPRQLVQALESLPPNIEEMADLHSLIERAHEAEKRAGLAEIKAAKLHAAAEACQARHECALSRFRQLDAVMKAAKARELHHEKTQKRLQVLLDQETELQDKLRHAHGLRASLALRASALREGLASATAEEVARHHLQALDEALSMLDVGIVIDACMQLRAAGIACHAWEAGALQPVTDALGTLTRFAAKAQDCRDQLDFLKESSSGQETAVVLLCQRFCQAADLLQCASLAMKRGNHGIRAFCASSLRDIQTKLQKAVNRFKCACQDVRVAAPGWRLAIGSPLLHRGTGAPFEAHDEASLLEESLEHVDGLGSSDMELVHLFIQGDLESLAQTALGAGLAAEALERDAFACVDGYFGRVGDMLRPTFDGDWNRALCVILSPQLCSKLLCADEVAAQELLRIARRQGKRVAVLPAAMLVTLDDESRREKAAVLSQLRSLHGEGAALDPACLLPTQSSWGADVTASIAKLQQFLTDRYVFVSNDTVASEALKVLPSCVTIVTQQGNRHHRGRLEGGASGSWSRRCDSTIRCFRAQREQRKAWMEFLDACCNLQAACAVHGRVLEACAHVLRVGEQCSASTAGVYAMSSSCRNHLTSSREQEPVVPPAALQSSGIEVDSLSDAEVQLAQCDQQVDSLRESLQALQEEVEMIYTSRSEDFDTEHASVCGQSTLQEARRDLQAAEADLGVAAQLADDGADAGRRQREHADSLHEDARIMCRRFHLERVGASGSVNLSAVRDCLRQMAESSRDLLGAALQAQPTERGIGSPPPQGEPISPTKSDSDTLSIFSAVTDLAKRARAAVAGISQARRTAAVGRARLCRLLDCEEASLAPIDQLRAQILPCMKADLVELQLQLEALGAGMQASRALLDKCRGVLTAVIQHVVRAANKLLPRVLSSLLPGISCRLQPSKGESLMQGVHLQPFVRASKQPVPWRQLSGGQQALMTVAFIIAMAEVQKGDIYVLDELDAALDYSNRQAVAKLVHGVFGTTGQVLAVSHHEHMRMAAAQVVVSELMPGGFCKVSTFEPQS